jgi:PiT family inorganic phosphate transporter
LKGTTEVRWTTVRDMVLAWIVTLPIAAVLACLAYFLFSRVI